MISAKKHLIIRRVLYISRLVWFWIGEFFSGKSKHWSWMEFCLEFRLIDGDIGKSMHLLRVRFLPALILVVIWVVISHDWIEKKYATYGSDNCPIRRSKRGWSFCYTGHWEYDNIWTGIKILPSRNNGTITIWKQRIYRKWIIRSMGGKNLRSRTMRFLGENKRDQ